jgi:hypothetical protein
MNRTFRGISIDRSDKGENGDDAIRFNRGYALYGTNENREQDAKHDDPRIAPFRGILTDRSDEDENADESIRFNREVG